jgi:hypothetical protein
MGSVSNEHQEAAEAASQVAAPRAPGAVVGDGLGSASLLALQRGAGNRAVGQALARTPVAGGVRGVRVLARAPTIPDDVFRITQALAKKQPPDAAVVTEAVEIAKRAHAEAVRLKGAKPIDADAVTDAYKEVQRVVSALISNDAENAAIDFARQADADVQTGALNALRNRYRGVDNQQHFISKAGRLAGVAVPEAGAKQTSADWLEKQTTAAGQTFKKLEDMGLKGLSNDPGALSLALVSELLNQYFSHAPNDVKPDPGGTVSKLTVDAAKQLEADCDVYASYGTRLLRAAGWQTVGYMAIVPAESTGRDAHAVALAKRSGSGGAAATYVSLSNAEVRQFTAGSDNDARGPLLTHGLDVYADPKPKSWSAYYQAAGANGAYDLKLLDPVKNGLTAYKTQ